ncbi:ABC1 kinase family protein [Halobacterium jilantaiense]|uniref:Predicted unusual protein kinase regulating ubiquinone biosynthesis, AarF/ABC1/UbiB family n=1 Tax=Halobacterium jilantaiense TaxID=355548 RepID=A0A1I0QEG6_9EURY|nr:AarF/ABC1/UbiB kinase family protein [Halobacterium jilantaiense]SEW25457.1 Predicted unusual protein kinase regulating ubiquinone biosynthesis, AarF/ABC1/UbiB family [Halobacterium jilantaiense]
MAVLRSYRRFVVVFWQFLPLLWGWARDKRRFLLFGGSRSVTPEMRRERAQILLDSLLALGPTFIKLGQLLSTRPDVLPPEYIDVLEELQDRVPPADWSAAKVVIEDELGPVDEVFDDFDRESISGASLGQVYTAKVDGDPVAVKIRRPGIEELVEADLRVIRWSIPLIVRFVGQGQAFSLENLADEFAKTIREEMDYAREGRMLQEIRGNFTDNPDIVIPRVYDDYSDARVLTMEYISGTKISSVSELEARNVDRSEVAETLEEAYLQMIITDGVFHADPHPGNLAVQDDGSIVFYDFGMSGRVDPFVQDKIVEFYIGVANQDIDGILDALIEMGTLSPEADRAVMADVMELAIQDARGEDIETYRVQQIIGKVEDTIYEFPLRLPPNLALVLRVATVVEGVCVTLDQDFDFITVATDYLADEGYREESIKQFVEGTAEDFQAAATSAVRVPPKLERALDRVEREDLHIRADLEDDNRVIDKLGRRVVLGLVLATSVPTTAFLYVTADLLSAGVSAAFTTAIALALYRSFRRRKSGLRASPQFTRQNLRERD